VVSDVICPRHPGGSQSGVLACSHVSADSIPVPAARPSRILVDDAEIDARFVVLACATCCSEFKLSADQPVSGDIFWNESRFPYVAPICSRCAIDVGYVSADDKDAV
jgi:hypothetical protein